MPRSSSSSSAARPLLWLVLALSPLLVSALGSVPELQQHGVAVATVDPNKQMSELNHRIAGGFLLAIGLCIIASERYKSLAWMRWLPPILFIAAGLFLAAWSDDEIWPRGNLSWSWLIYHDAEARQHKLYALLLIALGLAEALQASHRYRRPWLRVVFPVLAVIGGVSLFFHHHSAEVPAALTSSLVQDVHLNQVPSAAHIHEHGSASANNVMKADAGGIFQGPPHQHHLSGVEAKVQREHAWFAVVGFCVAFLKVLADSGKLRAGMRRYLWAHSVLVLALCLLFYTE
jgi:hypothetical protein